MTRYSPQVLTHRGWEGYSMVYVASTGVLQCGINQLDEALPDLTRISGNLAPEE